MTPTLSFIVAVVCAASAYELGASENLQAAAGLFGIVAVMMLAEVLS